MHFTILRFDRIDSTNNEAIKQAKLGADEGLCIVANEQTAGRGRYGRAWVSEKGAGLYFSVVLRPRIESRFLPLITLMTGIVVADSLFEFGLKPDIKWVNDILVNGKKISGILAETVETDLGLAVVVGIGINLKSSNFPAEISDNATSLEDEGGNRVSVDDLLETLTRFFGYFYTILCETDGPTAIIDEWRRRSSYYSGKSVRVVLGNEVVTGVTCGIEENGALRVRTADGEIRKIQAGDVEQLRQISAD